MMMDISGTTRDSSEGGHAFGVGKVYTKLEQKVPAVQTLHVH